MADKMVPHYLDLMVGVQDIQKLFDFILKAITAAEIMPKRAAAHFWVILLPSPSQLL